MPYDFSLWKRLEILKVEKDGDIIEWLVKPNTRLRFMTEVFFDVIKEVHEDDINCGCQDILNKTWNATVDVMIDFVAQIKINMKMECQIIREYYVGMFSIIFVPPQFADVILEYGWLFYCFCLLPIHFQVSALYQRPLHPPSPASAV